MYWPRPSVKGQAWPKSKMATANTDGTQQGDTSCTKRSSEEEVIITPEDSKLLEVISKLLISKKKGGSSKKNIINEAFKSLGLDENETEQLLNKLQTTNQIFSKKDTYFVVESKETSENFGNQSYNGKHDHDGSEKVKSNLKNVDVKMKSLNCNDESEIANMKLPDSGLFLEDYFEFKEHVFNELNKMKALAHQDINNNLKQLREENNFLKSELQDKQAVINILLSDLQKDRFKISGKSQEPELLLPEKNPWIDVCRTRRVPNTNSSSMLTFASPNRFNVLEHEIISQGATNSKSDHVVSNNSQKHSPGILVSKSSKRPNVVVNPYPERIQVNQGRRTVPGQSSYSEVVKKGRRVVVFGDSIPSRIRHQEFNDNLHQGHCQFKKFPGATVRDMKHYIEPTVERNTPDTVIIHCGTNDLQPRTGTELSEDEIAQIIIQIGERCKNAGVNCVMISSITSRRPLKCQKKRNIVNDKLRELCEQCGFVYIDNAEIRVDQHLWKDGLHLNESGTAKLANNFINAINRYY